MSALMGLHKGYNSTKGSLIVIRGKPMIYKTYALIIGANNGAVLVVG